MINDKAFRIWQAILVLFEVMTGRGCVPCSGSKFHGSVGSASAEACPDATALVRTDPATQGSIDASRSRRVSRFGQRAFRKANRDPFIRSTVRAPGVASRLTSINHTSCGDGPELLDAVAADADILVLEVDGRVEVARYQANLVDEAVGGARNAEPSVRVGGALVNRGGLVAYQTGPDASKHIFGRMPK